MNVMNRIEPNLAMMPLNVYENIFDHLSEISVFGIFAKVNKGCAESVKNYKEKAIIRVIGQKNYDEIPVLPEFVHSKIDCLMTQYIKDSSLPSVIRGENEDGLKFLFLRLNFKAKVDATEKIPCYFFIASKNIFNKEPLNSYNYYIYSELNNPFIGCNEVNIYCIKILQGLFKDGFYINKNEIRGLEIDTGIKYE